MSRNDYERFNDLVQKVIQVPHREIKAKLEEEKLAKKRKKSKKSSASRGVNGRA